MPELLRRRCLVAEHGVQKQRFVRRRQQEHRVRYLRVLLGDHLGFSLHGYEESTHTGMSANNPFWEAHGSLLRSQQLHGDYSVRLSLPVIEGYHGSGRGRVVASRATTAAGAPSSVFASTSWRSPCFLASRRRRKHTQGDER